MFRMQGNLPKVGIRPTIDGRRHGVRESLEETTMQMAKNAAKLIEENLRHASGEKVECIIADTTIGGVAESARCQKKFEEMGVALTLTVTPCWCYGSETMDMTPSIPKAIWGFNGTERPGAVYLAAADAGHTQLGIPIFSIYGKDVQDAGDNTIPKDVKEKILRFVKASIAAATMKNQSYLSIGYVAMGIMGSMVDAEFILDYLGMRTEFVDMSEIKRRIELEIYDREEFKKALEWSKSKCKIGKDKNKASGNDKERELEVSIKMAMIMRDLMVGNKNLADIGYVEEAEGHNAIVAGFQGQRHWTDFMPNGDFAEAILNSSFDWNGIRESFVLATENDSLNGISMLFAHLLTDRSQLFADVRTYWSPEAVKRVTGKTLTGLAKDGIIHLINSGAASLDWTGEEKADSKHVLKPFWDITKEEVEDCLKATEFSPAVREYFRGGGYSSTFLTKGDMPMTIIRLNLVKGLGPVLQIAEGFAVNVDEEIYDSINKRTDDTWPTTWFVPILTGKGSFKDVYSVMNDWGANHCAAAYGHIGADLITLSSILRIPVSMHNVNEERIFRPKAWKSFGTDSSEGSDFRACKHFGPLFGKITR